MPRFTAFGVDGCPAGWFYVVLRSSARPRWGVVKEIAELVRDARRSDRIFVDIPIGLPDNRLKKRDCDIMARKKLGRPRGSSVFPAPVRATLRAKDYEDAKRRSQKAIGKKLSKQAFAIIPKIREVDKLLRSDEKARRVVREVHPEICFWAFAGRPMEFSKTKPKEKHKAYEERLAVLESVRPSARREIEEILEEFLRKDVARDDAVDAMAAAITAGARNLRRLPPRPPKDSKGLPMEMVYAHLK